MPAGMIFEFAGSSIPTGWLACDGSAVSRTTYAALFSAISTTWGPGDGATTFNVPDKRGRVAIGDGTGTVVEALVSVASSGNGVPVTSNATKWITGMAVTLSNVSGFGGTIANGAVFVVRISSTNVRFASTLVLAQNSTPDVTITGTGTVTITGTLTARTVGQNGGEEAHAQSITELIAHTHLQTFAAGASVNIGGGILANSPNATSSTGGNVAANIMPPFVVAKYIIST